jgi:hypothetical protein
MGLRVTREMRKGRIQILELDDTIVRSLKYSLNFVRMRSFREVRTHGQEFGFGKTLTFIRKKNWLGIVRRLALKVLKPISLRMNAR